MCKQLTVSKNSVLDAKYTNKIEALSVEHLSVLKLKFQILSKYKKNKL